MTRCLLLLLLAWWSSPAFADGYEVSVGAGPAVFAVGDGNGLGVSALGRIDYQPSSWFRIGVQAQVVPGRNGIGRTLTQVVLGVLPRFRIGERFSLGAGAGATQAWSDTHMRDGISPVVLLCAGATVYRAGSSTFSLELDAFGGGGSDMAFPDERMGVSLDALVTW
jgi:hypothetical protein